MHTVFLPSLLRSGQCRLSEIQLFPCRLRSPQSGMAMRCTLTGWVSPPTYLGHCCVRNHAFRGRMPRPCKLRR